ncbi:MAG: hypothetical protein WC716_10910 [Chitinophagaceae bacterium]|jgi:hypothetical protein
MDKIVLDEMQLLQLKRFIRIEEGIKEADVVDEILDHLACKTEEMMNQDIFLSFEKAVQAAYYSFGFGGFRLMARQYEKTMKKLVWKEFKKAIPAVIFSNKMVMSLVWCCFLSLVAFWRERYFAENILSGIIVYLMMGTMLSFYIVQFKYSFLAKDSLVDLRMDKGALMWQKKVVRMIGIDILFLPFLFSNFYFKFNPFVFLVILMLFGFLSMVNSFAKMETMNRMKFKFGKTA